MTDVRWTFPPCIQVKETWSAGWEAAPAGLRLAAARLELAVAGGQDSVAFLRRYGPKVKYALETEWTEPAPPLVLRGWWVRVLDGDPASPRASTPLWQGRFLVDRRTLARHPDGLMGIQTLVAFGGVELLKRLEVSSSFWWNSGTNRFDELEHVPWVNMIGPHGELVGTRGPVIVGADAWGYGADDVWTARDYLEGYLLPRHVNAAGRPGYTLTGALEVLDERAEAWPMQASQSVLEILNRFIRREHGLGWTAVPTATGWELKVFSLWRDPPTWGVAALPGNLDRMTVSPSVDEDVLACEAEVSALQCVDRIEVLGERIESAVTIPAATKEAMWTAAQEAAYEAGTGNAGADTAVEHDRARADDVHRRVYTSYRANDAFDLQFGEACPALDDEGYVTGAEAPRQTVLREMLRRLPLREGGDYTQTSAALAEAGATADFLPLLALAYVSTAIGYAPVDRLSGMDLEGEDITVQGMAVSALDREWGLEIRPRVNHELGKNHMSIAVADSFIDPAAALDWEDVILTIGVRTDQRCRVRDVNSVPFGDGSKRVIEVPGAKVRWLTPGTTIGAEADGGAVKLSQSAVGLTLQNDNEMLHPIMAAAVERFMLDRLALQVVYRGLVPDPSWIGRVVELSFGEGDLAGRWGIVTAVWYDFKAGRSGLVAGFAG